jgi:hypothetical protein
MIDATITGKGDPYWRRALLFAKILARLETGHACRRDARLVCRLLENRGVTNRLIEQAHWVLKARKRKRLLSSGT